MVLCDFIQFSFQFAADIFRLGLAYSGSHREDVIELLTPVLEDGNSSFEVRGWIINIYHNIYFSCII